MKAEFAMKAGNMRRNLISLLALRRQFTMKVFWIVTVLVFVADQASKYAANEWLYGREPLKLIPGCLSLWFRVNTGAAFSLMENRTSLLALISAVVSLVLVLWSWKIDPGERGLRLWIGLIVGGAVGNMLDRVRLGYVVDFIHVYFGEYNWPTFNIADSAICVGMTVVLLAMFFPQERSCEPLSSLKNPKSDLTIPPKETSGETL